MGGWNCDRNIASRDAVVILNDQIEVVGKWRGNIRTWINEADVYQSFLFILFTKCGAVYTNEEVIIAVDTPLGYSHEFVKLLSEYKNIYEVASFQKNAYLYRKTERFLFANGRKPLSAVNHMIGSQSTKGIHFISKYAANISSIGIWKSDDKRMTVIETYPSKEENDVPEAFVTWKMDLQDAYKCAVLAEVFDNNNDKLYQPLKDIWEREGWIWVLSKNFAHGFSKLKY